MDTAEIQREYMGEQLKGGVDWKQITACCSLADSMQETQRCLAKTSGESWEKTELIERVYDLSGQCSASDVDKGVAVYRQIGEMWAASSCQTHIQLACTAAWQSQASLPPVTQGRGELLWLVVSLAKG